MWSILMHVIASQAIWWGDLFHWFVAGLELFLELFLSKSVMLELEVLKLVRLWIMWIYRASYNMTTHFDRTGRACGYLAKVYTPDNLCDVFVFSTYRGGIPVPYPRNCRKCELRCELQESKWKPIGADGDLSAKSWVSRSTLSTRS